MHALEDGQKKQMLQQTLNLSEKFFFASDRCVRGAVLTLVSDCSSSAEVHKGFKLDELVHMEVEAEDQESVVQDKKENEECEVEMYQDNDDIMRMTHAMTCAQHLELEPMSM